MFVKIILIKQINYCIKKSVILILWRPCFTCLITRDHKLRLFSLKCDTRQNSMGICVWRNMWTSFVPHTAPKAGYNYWICIPSMTWNVTASTDMRIVLREYCSPCPSVSVSLYAKSRKAHTVITCDGSIHKAYMHLYVFIFCLGLRRLPSQERHQQQSRCKCL